mmetsp:Transcript_23400/g.61471  ORF Transcript_23400/g.61471 Transcript_23400/m.61471 type:complete len:93 (-) Transcript_23400:941-1219(-)
MISGDQGRWNPVRRSSVQAQRRPAAPLETEALQDPAESLGGRLEAWAEGECLDLEQMTETQENAQPTLVSYFWKQQRVDHGWPRPSVLQVAS